MSFKSFSTAQATPAKAAEVDKSKNAPAASQPAIVPAKAATDMGPQQKS